MPCQKEKILPQLRLEELEAERVQTRKLQLAARMRGDLDQVAALVKRLRQLKTRCVYWRHLVRDPEGYRETLSSYNKKRYTTDVVFRAKAQQRARDAAAADPDKNRSRARAYGREHPEENRMRAEARRMRDPEACRLSVRRAKLQNADKHRKQARLRERIRMKEDPLFRLKVRLRSRLRFALKKFPKAGTSERLMGCSWEELRAWLQVRFLPGMGWDNYGKWHVDHKRPCAAFDLSDPEQQKLCFHYTNLQPLWALDNIRKGARCV